MQIVIIFFISFIVFFLTYYVTGDPVKTFIGLGIKFMSKTEIQFIREEVEIEPEKEKSDKIDGYFINYDEEGNEIKTYAKGNIKPEDIELGPYVKSFHATKSGHITEVNNAIINEIAKAASCPTSKSSGVIIHRKQGAKIKEGDLIFQIFSDSESRMEKAEKIYNST